MKKLLPILLLSSVSYALNAPYLISATALSDSSVALSWRNNDIATTGYLIQRKDSTETSYHFIDSITPATQLTYADTNGLLPTTLYTYQVIAYDSTSVSDTSNSVQVTTLARTWIFKQPNIYEISWRLTSAAVEIRFRDSSDCEIGYRLLRAENFSPVFTTILDLPSANPDSMGYRTLYDSSVSYNTWYSYKIEVYKSDSSISSPACSVYTLQAVPPARTVLFNQLSTFPLSVSGWSAKAGDSIILQENPAPAGMFTVINISDPANPSFSGYIDSAAVRSYPARTLIPALMRHDITYNCGYPLQQVLLHSDKIIAGKAYDATISLYQIQSDTMSLLDTLWTPIKSLRGYSIRGETRGLMMLHDSLLAISFRVQYSSYPSIWTNRYLYPVRLTSAAFSPLSDNFIDSNYSNMEPTGSENLTSRTWFHGFYGQNTMISADELRFRFYGYRDTILMGRKFIVRDSSSSTARIWNSGLTNTAFGNGYNTGRYISPTEALSTNAETYSSAPTSLFVADVRDYDAYIHAVSNNAVFTVDTQYTQSKLWNILLDTLNRHVYLIYTNGLVILGYSFGTPSSTIFRGERKNASNTLHIIPGSPGSGVTIVRPGNAPTADFYFYDLKGRVVDRMLGVMSNAVLWRPKTNTLNCYIVMVKSGQEKYIKKFMVR